MIGRGLGFVMVGVVIDMYVCMCMYVYVCVCMVGLTLDALLVSHTGHFSSHDPFTLSINLT
jgi:hypothetical protein